VDDLLTTIVLVGISDALDASLKLSAGKNVRTSNMGTLRRLNAGLGAHNQVPELLPMV
jgi:hypothetical protein